MLFRRVKVKFAAYHKGGELNMEQNVTIECLCGRKVILGIVGGQYQNVYQGECECDRKWSLEEQSEALAELGEES